MATLLAAFNASQSEDKAFAAAYGLDRDGVYNAWRKSVGLPQIAAAPSGTQTSPQRNSAAPVPTVAGAAGSDAQATQPPAPAPVQSQPSSSGSTDTTATVVLVVAGVAIFLALLAIAVTGGLMLSKRGSRPS